jgi:hypothetical protein
MDEITRHGIEARRDWSAYYTAAVEGHPRYHNRPACEAGAAIKDEDIRAGTDYRPLCDDCRQAQKHVN